jgi:allantoin racemase
MTRVLFINPVGDDLFDRHFLELLQGVRAPGTQVEVRSLDLPPELAGPMLPPQPLYHDAILRLALDAERDGYDAVVIACCSDPSLPEAQRSLGIPVVGPLQAAAATCAARGKQLGILFPDEHDWRTTLGWVRGNLRLYGLADVVGAIRFVPFRAAGEPGLIGNASIGAAEVLARFRRQLDDAVVQAKALVEEDGAQAVLFGCTLWAGMIAGIADQVDAIALDPLVTALKVAELQAAVGLLP